MEDIALSRARTSGDAFSVRPTHASASAECLRWPQTVVRDCSCGHGARPAISAPIGTRQPSVARTQRRQQRSTGGAPWSALGAWRGRLRWRSSTLRSRCGRIGRGSRSPSSSAFAGKCWCAPPVTGEEESNRCARTERVSPARAALPLPIGTKLTPRVPLRLQIDRKSQVVAWLAARLSSFGHGVVGRGRVGGVPEDARDALLVAALRFRCAWHVPGEHDVGSLVGGLGAASSDFCRGCCRVVREWTPTGRCLGQRVC